MLPFFTKILFFLVYELKHKFEVSEFNSEIHLLLVLSENFERFVYMIDVDYFLVRFDLAFIKVKIFKVVLRLLP